MKRITPSRKAVLNKAFNKRVNIGLKQPPKPRNGLLLDRSWNIKATDKIYNWNYRMEDDTNIILENMIGGSVVYLERE